MKRIPVILLLVGIFVSACGVQPSPSLIGSWRLTAYGPKDAPTPAVTDAPATLTFDPNGSLTGNGGCNSLGGSYKLEGNKITFSEVISTLMACDDARMAQEGVVTKVLSGTAEYTIKDNTLTLSSDNIVLIFTSASSSYPAPSSYPYP